MSAERNVRERRTDLNVRLRRCDTCILSLRMPEKSIVVRMMMMEMMIQDLVSVSKVLVLMTLKGVGKILK